MKQCQVCGTFSSDDITFCSVCGKRFPNAMDAVVTHCVKPEHQDEQLYNGKQKTLDAAHPEIVPLLQRIVLFLEDEEFDRADDYCERVLDIEPTNAEAYIGKLLVEFRCSTREQLKNCTSTIVNSKNYAKIVRFGNEEQKTFVVDAEKNIQDRIVIIAKEAQEKSIQEVEIVAEQIIESDQQEADFDGAEEYYIDILCPYCHEELSYTNWQINESELTCPMCDSKFEYSEGLRR